MKVNGKWVGWGYGDSDPKIAEMKAFLKRKYTWVREWQPPLDDSALFDANFVSVVRELQHRLGLPTSGVMNAVTQEKCGFWKPPKIVLPVAMSVHGTGVADPMAGGLPADTCRYLESIGKCRWQPIGNYPAEAFPMWPSIMKGVAEVALQVERYFDRDIWLVGYSQGAVVICYYWKHYVQDPAGPHHHRLHDPNNSKPGTIKKLVAFGNPMREKGFCHPDGGLPIPADNTSGILEDRMVGSPPYMRDYGHKGDLYSACEFSDKGEDKRAICKIVMGNQVFTGSDSILAQVFEIVTRPVPEVMAMVGAIYDAGLFFVKKTEPHIYDIRPAIDFLAA